MSENQFKIEDSGDRRDFETGAVRDVDDNKPRFGLIPITALLELLERRDIHRGELVKVSIDKHGHMSDHDKNTLLSLGFLCGWKTEERYLQIIVWACLDAIGLQEKDRTLQVRNANLPGFHLISPKTYERLAMHYARGAQKYDPWNWSKGMPFSVFYESLMRHIFKIVQNNDNEDHLSAIFFNAAAILHFQCIGRDDLDDITPRLKEWHSNEN